MTMTIGLRELSRNTRILDDYDYVEIEDKKTHKLKGLFISPKYADEFKRFLKEKISKKQQEKLDRLMKYTGKNEILTKFDNLTSSQISKKVVLEKYEN